MLDALVAAERSGTPASSYERVFGFSDADFRGFLQALITTNIPGSELCLESFHIAQNGAVPVAALAAWVEGADKQSSNYLKGPHMAALVGMERWVRVQAHMRELTLPIIPRKAGTLQIDELFVAESARGNGIASQLIQAVVAQAKHDYPGIACAQGMCILENRASRKAFLAAGFQEVHATTASNTDVSKYMPGTGRVLFECTL